MSGFHHRDHIRSPTWRSGELATYQQAPQKYHHTISRAWVELVARPTGPTGRGGAEPDVAPFPWSAGAI